MIFKKIGKKKNISKTYNIIQILHKLGLGKIFKKKSILISEFEIIRLIFQSI